MSNQVKKIYLSVSGKGLHHPAKSQLRDYYEPVYNKGGQPTGNYRWYLRDGIVGTLKSIEVRDNQKFNRKEIQILLSKEQGDITQHYIITTPLFYSEGVRFTDYAEGIVRVVNPSFLKVGEEYRFQAYTWQPDDSKYPKTQVEFLNSEGEKSPWVFSYRENEEGLPVVPKVDWHTDEITQKRNPDVAQQKQRRDFYWNLFHKNLKAFEGFDNSALSNRVDAFEAFNDLPEGSPQQEAQPDAGSDPQQVVLSSTPVDITSDPVGNGNLEDDLPF